MEVVKIGKAAPDQDLIRGLTDILKHAEEGNIAHLAFVCEFNNKVVRTYTTHNDPFLLIALLERLKHRVHVDLDEIERPVVYGEDGEE